MTKLVLLLALVACSGGNRPTTTSGGDPVRPPPGDPPIGPPPESGGGEPARPLPPSCDKKIAIKCTQGIDGCAGNKTKFHWCVPSDAKSGPTCDKEIALVCPAGQIDACLNNPQVAANHICVFN